MTAHTNPLMDRKAGGGRVTAEGLRDYADQLNQADFVRGRGWKYYVGRRVINGVELASLERHDLVASL